jgi:L-malate glycosyltransferase
MEHKRVCITTLEFPPDVGGVGESVQRIAQMLVNLGYEVHVAVFRSRHNKSGEVRRASCQTTLQDGISVHRLWAAARLEKPALHDYLSEIYFLLRKLHEQHNFDIFHSFFLTETGFLTTLLAREFGIPVITSIRGADLHKHVFDPKQHGQIFWVLENSNWVTFVSRELMQRAKILVPTIQEKSSAFWNSIVPFEFTPCSTPPLVKQLQGTVIGCVGRFRDKKGLEFLLDACAVLKSEMELTLLLVGDFAEYERTYWEQLIQASDMGDRMVLTGMLERSQALAYLPYIDIFAVPSLRDGCPNALLEAMLASRAIIGSNVDAIGEILQDGEDAMVIDPGSSKALIEAIRTLAQSPELRQQLGQAAKIKALTQLAPHIEQENWDQVYRHVLETMTLQKWRSPEFAKSFGH